MLKFAGLMVLVLVLASCATDYSKKSPDEIASTVKVIDSEFDTSRFVAAPEINATVQLGLSYSARLMATQDKKSGQVFHGLSVQWSYTLKDWFMFKTADVEGGKRLDSKVGKREVESCGVNGMCNYIENITALVSLDDLKNAQTAGLRVRFNSQNGSYIVVVPANYIGGYLQGIEKLRK